MGPPEFPPPFIIERSRNLGFGTGPWTREQFVALWGAPMADKYVAEAKAVGWLVSPARGVYHVPDAQDIMVVAWLPEPARTEFLISRTLAAAGIRAWCLSAWCRERGLSLPDTVFVTDLTPTNAPARRSLDRRAIQAAAATAAATRNTLPFLDNLLIIPAMPPTSVPRAQLALVPESQEATERKRQETQASQPVLGAIGLVALALEKNVARIASDWENVQQRDANSRGIPYAVDGRLEDDAWITALLAAIGSSRVEELAITRVRATPKAQTDTIQRWASLIGPPQPVSMWKETLREGPFPFMLVPPPLWAEMGADQAARRYRTLDRLARR